jgi:hypothetical protein
MDRMDIKYTNLFHCKTLQSLPKLGFLVWKQTIWHPWWRRSRTYVHTYLVDYGIGWLQVTQRRHCPFCKPSNWPALKMSTSTLQTPEMWTLTNLT